MTAEFIDTNVLVYAEDAGMGAKHGAAVELPARLASEDSGALSTQARLSFQARFECGSPSY